MDDGCRRVVITGLGAITPLGLSVRETWEGLLAGRSGIARLTQFDPSSCESQIGGEVRGFEPTQFMDRKEARRMARFSQFAVAAAGMALRDAGLDLADGERERIGVVLGTGIGAAIGETVSAYQTILERGPGRVSPFYVTTMLPNMASFQVSYIYGLRGPSSTIVTACAAGAQAIGEAFAAIRRGAVEAMLAGGAEASHCLTGISGFCAMKALSTRNDEPERASRPFDQDRDGFVVSEGCGMLILEELGHALGRGAPIYAELLGYGASCDAYHLSAPDPTGEGAARAMRKALEEAGKEAEEVDYVNAHATSTTLGDVAETLAIKKALGEHAYRIPVNATKSMTGHMFGASGAVEIIVSALTIRDGVVHPTINYETPDPDCDLDYVPNTCRKAEVNLALSNSFAFGGVNISLLVGRYVKCAGHTW